MVSVLQAAVEFERPMRAPPKGMSEEVEEQWKSRNRSRLSKGGKAFAEDLIKWFGAIQRAGQDAFILWW
jgi:hypothetical protein